MQEVYFVVQMMDSTNLMALNSGIPAASFWRRGEIGSRTGLLIPQPSNSGYESSTLSVSALINSLHSHLTTALQQPENARKSIFFLWIRNMIFDKNWIDELVPNNLTPEELASKLSMAGLEAEVLENTDLTEQNPD